MNCPVSYLWVSLCVCFYYSNWVIVPIFTYRTPLSRTQTFDFRLLIQRLFHLSAPMSGRNTCLPAFKHQIYAVFFLTLMPLAVCVATDHHHRRRIGNVSLHKTTLWWMLKCHIAAAESCAHQYYISTPTSMCVSHVAIISWYHQQHTQ